MLNLISRKLVSTWMVLKLFDLPGETKPSTGAFLQDHLIAISQLAQDQEHLCIISKLNVHFITRNIFFALCWKNKFLLQLDVAIPPQHELVDCLTRRESLSLMHNILHNEIDSFCKQAVKRVTRSLQVLWPRSRTNIFGSTATGLSLPTSDVDHVVCLPPVRNLKQKYAILVARHLSKRLGSWRVAIALKKLAFWYTSAA
ncbi:polymerase, nucleotidyl transferase domain [Dillenia turbinata]|uniref:Polymerase, nucleotidyl transferase domain n=1 Tax=Dillenia turbinata TaxID=194707 RepID=A0AAN8UNM4_9MAGN